MTTAAPSTTLSSFLHDCPIKQRIGDTEAKIRAEPREFAHRRLLFQLLCLTGDWARAMKLLPTAAREEAGEAFARIYQPLIDAELARGEVFSGMRAPEFMGEPPEWALALVEALALESIGDQAAADGRRDAGLSAAPSVAGYSPLGGFDWMADADSRLGPVCEVMSAGKYFWVPFDRIAALFIPEPSDITDLIWTPVSLVLASGEVLQAHLPARYPGSEAGSDAVRLGRETHWREQGETGSFGLGQKMWMHGGGEWALLDVRECHFGPEAGRLDDALEEA